MAAIGGPAKKLNQIFLSGITAAGIMILLYNLTRFNPLSDPDVIWFAVITILAGSFTARFPTKKFIYTLHIPFLVFALLNFGAAAAMWIAVISTFRYFQLLTPVKFIYFLSSVSLALFSASLILPAHLPTSIVLQRDIWIIIPALLVGDLIYMASTIKFYCIRENKKFFSTFFQLWVKNMSPFHVLLYTNGIIMSLLFREYHYTGLMVSLVPVSGLLYHLKTFNQLHKQMEMANTDALTKIENRHAFFQWWNKAFKKMKNKTISILMIDIDSFKRINDTYGHRMGDRVLIEVVNIIKDSIRENDYLFRYGGEEFVALIPNATSDEAENIARRIRSTINNNKLSYIENDSVTVSIGIASQSIRTSIEDDENLPDKLIQKADDAMYQAKREGKNRICTYEDQKQGTFRI